MLTLVSFVSYADRQVLAILIEPVKHDLHLSDTQMGMLTGLFFSAFYVVAGLPLARLADTGNRRSVIAACIGIWSVATAACGMVVSFSQLALARTLVSIGEAGTTPATASLVADIFPPERQTRAFAFISAGTAAGVAFGVYCGGLLNGLLGWRNVFLVLGLPGLLLSAVVYLTVREPVRTSTSSTLTRPSMVHAFRSLWRLASYRAVVVLTILPAFSTYAVLGWMPSFLIRVHHMSTADVGLEMGTAIAGGLLLGNVSCGFVTDRLCGRDPRWLIWVSGLGLLICFPFGLLSLFLPGATASVIALALFMYALGFWAPPTMTLIIGLADRRFVALASSTIPLYQAVGGALGPVLVGFLNDRLAPAYGHASIRYSIALSLVGLLIGTLTAFLAAPAVARDYQPGGRRSRSQDECG